MQENDTNVSIDIRETTDYLRQYQYGMKMLEMNRYERDYFDADNSPRINRCAEDEAYVKAKMFEIKRFVTNLPPDDRKLFLYYHYIHGETVERCGELLHISRRSAFRLKRRALEFAAIRYRNIKRNDRGQE